MNENVPDVPDWIIRAVEEADAVWRDQMPFIRGVQQYMEDVRKAWTFVRPLRAYADQVDLAIDAGMAQLATFIRQEAEHRNVTASASLTITPIMVADADVVRATERESVTVLDGPTRATHSIDRLAFALILVWLVALAMPAAQPHLPREAQDILNTLYKTIPIALTVTLVARQKRKG